MIGNDVVDLTDPEAQPGATHPRFDSRVFTAAEQAAVSASDAPTRLRWRLWAAKEAAYKLARKLEPSVVFSPSCFEVSLGHGLVRHAARSFAVDVEETEDYVHVVASTATPSALGASEARLFGVHAEETECQMERGGPWRARPATSERVRSLAMGAIAHALQVDTRDLAIVTRDRIPRVELRGEPAAVDLSLSHHGRFVAYAFELWSQVPGPRSRKGGGFRTSDLGPGTWDLGPLEGVAIA